MPDGPPSKCPHCQVEFRAEDIAGRKTCPVCGGQLAEPRPPSAALGFVILLALGALLYWGVNSIFFDQDSKKSAKAPQVRSISDAIFDKQPCRTIGGRLFSTTEAGLKRLLDIRAQQDANALIKALSLSGNGMLKPDLAVYVVDTSWSLVQFRLKGETITAWTDWDSIDCKSDTHFPR